MNRLVYWKRHYTGTKSSPMSLTPEKPLLFIKVLKAVPICASCAGVNVDVGYVGLLFNGSFCILMAYNGIPLFLKPWRHFNRYVASSNWKH